MVTKVIAKSYRKIKNCLFVTSEMTFGLRGLGEFIFLVLEILTVDWVKDVYKNIVCITRHKDCKLRKTHC
jgi:hypothetical protein